MSRVLTQRTEVSAEWKKKVGNLVCLNLLIGYELIKFCAHCFIFLHTPPTVCGSWAHTLIELCDKKKFIKNLAFLARLNVSPDRFDKMSNCFLTGVHNATLNSSLKTHFHTSVFGS